MKLILNGNINVYYVQTLCMIFFPGAKFGADAQNDPEAPELFLTLKEDADGLWAAVTVSFEGNTASAEKFHAFSEEESTEKISKLVCGKAIVAACGELLGYRPSWGMLTGVRPSKVATELLQKGMSKTRVKRTLTSDYFVIPKKATLATEVALNEQKIISIPLESNSVYSVGYITRSDRRITPILQKFLSSVQELADHLQA